MIIRSSKEERNGMPMHSWHRVFHHSRNDINLVGTVTIVFMDADLESTLFKATLPDQLTMDGTGDTTVDKLWSGTDRALDLWAFLSCP